MNGRDHFGSFVGSKRDFGPRGGCRVLGGIGRVVRRIVQPWTSKKVANVHTFACFFLVILSLIVRHHV